MNTDNLKKQIQDAFDREEGIKRFILTCSCHNMDKRAKEAFSLLFSDAPMPEIVRGRDRLYKLGKSLDNQHILAISKLSGKLAYYVELDDNNIITKEINLLTGGRIG